jgi:L-ascorbate metabolism protein UlaG (beta-lactamase superfamily)
VVSDEGSAEALGEAGADVEVVHDGDELALGGLALRVAGRDHAAVHPEVPLVPTSATWSEGGCSTRGRPDQPGEPVEVLAVPAGAPWLKLADAVDYLRTVDPRVAVPVHEKALSEVGISSHYRLLEQLRGPGTAFRVLDDGRPVEL